MISADVVIVGAGHGGASAAVALRQQGFSGSILLVGREGLAPYERPPLSKEYLAREKTFERLMIRPADFWQERAVETLLDQEVISVDEASRQAKLADGRSIAFKHLIWSAGGDARKMNCPGADLANVHTVRTRADVDAIMAQIDAGAQRVVIVGGGYIGLEGAAVLRKLGLEVTLLEREQRLLSRVAGEDIAQYFTQQHRKHGVDIRLDTGVNQFLGEDGEVSAVELSDGTMLPADIVIVGIGIIPAVEPLERAGAQCSNGLHVDPFCETSLKDIYAIGDCALHANAFADGASIRLESVQNASDMANIAASAICGNKVPYLAVPWFWSNQYDLKLQTVGLSMGFDQTVLRGNPESGKFTVIYLKSGKIVALDCVNRPADFVQGKKLIESGLQINPALLADDTTKLKTLIAEA